MKQSCSKLSQLTSSLETQRLTHDKRRSWIFFLGQKRLERDKHELLMRQIVILVFFWETIGAYSKNETNRFNGAC
jgi:hypothetical protein